MHRFSVNLYIYWLVVFRDLLIKRIAEEFRPASISLIITAFLGCLNYDCLNSVYFGLSNTLHENDNAFPDSVMVNAISFS